MNHSIKPKSPKILNAMHSRAEMIMFHGPRNTSKSYTTWKSFAFYHEMIPNLQSFIVRNEAKTLAKTVLKTFLRMVKYPVKKHKENPFEIVGGPNFPQRILWDNGGITEMGGLDDPDKILGGDYHMGWYNEIQRERREESFSNLLGCFVGDRAGPLPDWVPWRYRMYMDCNPTSPAHFIYRRKDEQAAMPIKQRSMEWYNILHEDNPMLSIWDDNIPANFLGLNQRGKNNEKDLLTAYPPGYMRDRMVYGIPRGAEGMVYQMWDPKFHVKHMNRSDFPDSETVWRWSIDIGGRDPHAIGIFAQKGNKHYLYKEVCRSSRDEKSKISDVIDMVEVICRRENIPRPATVFIDWNVKEFKIQLEERGYPVVLADKDVLLGVESCKEALANGIFFVNQFSLEERDPLLGSDPQGLKEEIPSYAHKPLEKRSGSVKDDLPDQSVGNDHFLDMWRYYMHSLHLAPIAYDINYSADYYGTNTRIDTGEPSIIDGIGEITPDFEEYGLIPDIDYGGEYFESF